MLEKTEQKAKFITYDATPGLIPAYLIDWSLDNYCNYIALRKLRISKTGSMKHENTLENYILYRMLQMEYRSKIILYVIHHYENWKSVERKNYYLNEKSHGSAPLWKESFHSFFDLWRIKRRWFYRQSQRSYEGFARLFQKILRSRRGDYRIHRPGASSN